MTIGFNETLRNARADEVGALADAGPGDALLRIYDGGRPATGGAPTNLLAELPMSDPAFAAAVAGVLTANAISDVAAAATGNATWARVVDSTGAFVFDASVGTSGADLNLNTISIVVGVNVAVGSFGFTEGNA